MRIIPEATFDRGRSSISRDEWAMVVVALVLFFEEDNKRPPESINIAKFPDRLVVVVIVVVVSSNSSGVISVAIAVLLLNRLIPLLLLPLGLGCCPGQEGVLEGIQ